MSGLCPPAALVPAKRGAQQFLRQLEPAKGSGLIVEISPDLLVFLFPKFSFLLQPRLDLLELVCDRTQLAVNRGRRWRDVRKDLEHAGNSCPPPGTCLALSNRKQAEANNPGCLLPKAAVHV